MVDFDVNSVLTDEGQLDPGWFQGKTHPQVVAMLEGFAAEGNALSEPLDADEALQTLAVKYWVYAQGYDWIAGDLSSRLGTIEIANEVRKTTDKAGPAYFAKKAAEWLAKFYALVPTARPAANTRLRSHSFTAGFRP